MSRVPTKSMREEAQRYRDWKREGRKGGTDVAARRATQILSGNELSDSTIRVMSAWFARHEVDKQAQGFRPGEPGYPSPGRVAWAAWGGDPGKRWSDSHVTTMDNDRELESSMSAGQAALYEAYEEIADELGAFDQTSGEHGSHYMPESPFISSGLQCANCAFYAGSRACEIVSGDIAPEGLCKFWIIPERLITESPEQAQGRPFPQEHAARLRDPSAYDTFRRRNNAAGRGVDFIFGIKSGQSGAELQAIRFRLSRFTAAEAKQWLSDHDYKPIQFEEATGKRTKVDAPKQEHQMDSTEEATPLERALNDKHTRTEATNFRAIEDRTFEFPFSSEYPVARYFGNEVLSHDNGAAELSRLNDGAPLLFNHNPDKVVGVVERAWINEADKRGYAKVRFSRNAFAQEILNDVRDNILRGVSFGYAIDKMEERSGDFVATRWSPHEISVVSIPADPTIGIGRSLIAEQIDQAAPLKMDTDSTTSTKEEVRTQAASAASPTPTSMENTTPDVEVIRSKAVEAERTRISAITALGAKHQLQDLARELIDGGRSLDEARAAVLDKLGQTTVEQPIDLTSNDVGLSDKETRSFSFVRALNYLANTGDRKLREEAAFEIEVGEAAAKKYERSSNGIVVPNEVLRRDLVVGTSTAGGNLVASELLTGSFIDLLRNRMALMQANVTMLSGLQGNIAIPRQASAATAYWVGENSSPTESQQSIDQVNMTPKTVGAYVDYSRRLLLQSSVDVEGMIRNDLAKVIALELDRAGIYGTGSTNQPLGLTNTTGIGSQTITTYGTYTEYVSMETKVAVANADVASMFYIINANARGALKTTEKSAGGTIGNFAIVDNTLNGYPVITSNQLGTNDCLFGDFSQLVMGLWSGLDLTVDPYAGSTAGTVRVIALQDVDFAVKQPGAFVFGT